MVEARGFEPLTPGLQSRCSSQLSYAPMARGTLPRTPTDDPRRRGGQRGFPRGASGSSCERQHHGRDRGMVGVLGLEPRTSALSGLRSSQLSYTPEGAGVYLHHVERQARASPGRARAGGSRRPVAAARLAPHAARGSVQRRHAAWRREPWPALRALARGAGPARAQGEHGKNDTSHATSLSRGSWKETPGVDLLSRREAVSSAPRA